MQHEQHTETHCTSREQLRQPKPLLLDVLRQPPEAISVPHLANYAAHEELDRANAAAGVVHPALASGAARES